MAHHSHAYSGQGGRQRYESSTTAPGGDTYTDAFHTYGLEWRPGVVKWYIDGEVVKTLTNENVAAQLMYIAADLGVGGAFVGPVDPTALPAAMEIDYIRAYQRKDIQLTPGARSQSRSPRWRRLLGDAPCASSRASCRALSTSSTTISRHISRALVGRHPAEPLTSLPGISQQRVDLGRPEIARIDADDDAADRDAGRHGRARGHHARDLLDTASLEGELQSRVLGGPADEVAHRVLLAAGDDEVLRRVLLQHQPLGAHVVAGMTPVAQRIHVADVETAPAARARSARRPG